MVEVWRPGGRSEERRPRHDRNRPRHHDRPAQGAASPLPPSGSEAATPPRASVIAADGEQPISAGRAPTRRRPKVLCQPLPPMACRQARRAKTGATVRRASVSKARAGRRPATRQAAGSRSQGKPPGKFGGGDRDKGGRDKGGRDKGGFGGKGGRDSGPSHRQWATSAAPRERDRPADPNSPFAKLAALKEQLAAGRKDS